MISHVVRHNAVRGRPRGPLLISVNHRLLSKADPLVLMGHSAGAHLVSLDNQRRHQSRRQRAGRPAVEVNCGLH